MASPSQSSSKMARGAVVVYFVAAALWSLPLLDLANIAFPPAISQLAWRIGFAGVAAQTLTTQIVACGLVLLAAIVRDDNALARFVAWFCLFCAVLLVAILGTFAFDLIQVRATVPAP